MEGLMEQLRAFAMPEDQAQVYTDFSELSFTQIERLEAMYALDKQARQLERTTREEDNQWQELFFEVAATLRQALRQRCGGRVIGSGAICGAKLNDEVNDNARRCRQHIARSPWMRAPALSAQGQCVPAPTQPPGGTCLWCEELLGRDPRAQCLICERGIHLECLASALDPALEIQGDPMVYCALCYTEVYDEVLAYRALAPDQVSLVINRESVWDDGENMDVYLTRVVPAVATQARVRVLATEYSPPTPTPVGHTPLSAARARAAARTTPGPEPASAERSERVQYPIFRRHHRSRSPPGPHLFQETGWCICSGSRRR